MEQMSNGKSAATFFIEGRLKKRGEIFKRSKDT